MLSLTGGKRIAIIDDNKRENIFLKEDDEDKPAEIDTSKEQKEIIFKNYLEMDKKLTQADITALVNAYKKDDPEVEGKLGRKYENALRYVDNSLKKHLDFGTKHKLFPIVDDSSFRLYTSGASGSGKSTAIAEFVKRNKPKVKEAGIFLFSPIHKDEALDKIPNLIRLSLEEFEAECGRELEVEDLPRGSYVIFDDVESFPKAVLKKYLNLRDIFLERGRHRDITTITVSHNSMNGHTTKASIRESGYWFIFPKFNARDSRSILKTYGGLDKEDIEKVMSMKSRWVFFKKTVPKYAISEHSVILFD
jgi:hypothetical protein